MKNIATRVLLVLVAIPSLYSLALFVPFMHHLPIALVIFAFCAGAGLELGLLLEPAADLKRRVGMALLALAVPLVSYAALLLPTQRALVSWLAAAGATVMGLLLASGAFLALPRRKDTIERSLRRAGSDALLAVYPGTIASALVPVLAHPDGGQLLVWFSVIAFSNDSLAWLVGISMGRHRGIFPVSPNKSLEGLIAGLAGSVLGAILGPWLFPGLVPTRRLLLAAMGLACGLAVVAGDLFESALKRAASVKDSGTSIPGRGGFLDSFDSIAFCAPVFAAFLAALGLL